MHELVSGKLTRAMSDSAGFDLFRFSLTILSAVFGGGVSAAATALLCAVSTSDTALTPHGPRGPSSVNCTWETGE